MTAAKKAPASKPAAKAAPRRATLAPAPRPAAAPTAAPAIKDGETLAVGKDPRGSIEDLNPRAAPPTPTREQSKSANEPGLAGNEGGLATNLGATPDAKPARKRLAKDDNLVSVTVHNAFKLQDDHGAFHEYGIGVQDMPRDHAEHWYAVKQGVEKNED